MIAVFVTFRYGEDFSAPKLNQLAESARAKFEGMLGLSSNYSASFPSCGKPATSTFGITRSMRKDSSRRRTSSASLRYTGLSPLSNMRRRAR